MQNFSKPLSETDIKHRLAVPCEAVRSLLPFNGRRRKFDFSVFDVGGNLWPMACTICKHKGTEYPKPELTKGWLKFARFNKLKAGDRITFRAAGAAYFTVEVEVIGGFGDEATSAATSGPPYGDAARAPLYMLENEDAGAIVSSPPHDDASGAAPPYSTEIKEIKVFNAVFGYAPVE